MRSVFTETNDAFFQEEGFTGRRVEWQRQGLGVRLALYRVERAHGAGQARRSMTPQTRWQ